MTSARTKAERQALIDELAAQLGERQSGPRAQIARIVNKAAIDFAREVYQLTLETEAQGGLMLPDGSRRRTVGGVFFYLARTRLSDELRAVVFPGRRKRHLMQPQPPTAPAPAPLLSLVWEERAAVIADLQTQPGRVSSLKVVLLGRPERVEQTQERITLWISDRVERVTLPRGVPKPPSGATVYQVYVAAKQWQRVESALEHPEDQLIIEGIVAFDSSSQAMVVYATQATSIRLETQRKAKKAEGRSLQP